jgi:acyl carrier protein
MSSSLLAVVNEVRTNKGQPSVEALASSLRWREDLGFESLDLAELTVRIEEKFGVDVFADGIVTTVGEVVRKIEKAGRT